MFVQLNLMIMTGMGMAQSSFSSSTTPIPSSAIPVAYYDEIKDLPNHQEKLLVDVREPSINVPCNLLVIYKKCTSAH